VRGAAGQAEAAGRLFAAADALRDAIDLPLSPSDRADLAPYLAAARARLDGATWDAAWEEGRAMSPERAITTALGDAPEASGFSMQGAEAASAAVS